jgi:hypothetical protein
LACQSTIQLARTKKKHVRKELISQSIFEWSFSLFPISSIRFLFFFNDSLSVCNYVCLSSYLRS